MKRSMASIFCDGACSGNGTRHAKAGWAWAYWPGRATGEAEHSGSGVPPAPATNQRAELTALLESLQWWRGLDGRAVTVYTDSMYSINCMTTWGPGWKRKGWTRAGGEPLQNLDLIVPLVDLWAAEAASRGWRVQHVRGHQSGSSPEAWGNNYVDRLAVVAAGGATPPPRLVFTPAPTPTATHTQRPLQMDASASHVTHPPPPSGNPFVSPKLQPVRQTSLDFWFSAK
jgi:ribonuclease HI